MENQDDNIVTQTTSGAQEQLHPPNLADQWSEILAGMLMIRKRRHRDNMIASPDVFFARPADRAMLSEDRIRIMGTEIRDPNLEKE